MDIFESYLQKKQSSNIIKRALTDVSMKSGHYLIPKNQSNADFEILGDAILKEALYDRRIRLAIDMGVEAVNMKKEAPFADKQLVEKIGKHYDILKYIDYNKMNTTLLPEYKRSPVSRHILAAVKAMITAIYKEENYNLSPIENIIVEWRELL